MDPESAEWVRALAVGAPARDAAVARLYAGLLRIARAECGRRGVGGDVDDLAQQAATDAVVAVLAKLGEFRGESRFTTWAYKFVVFEVSATLGRHFRRTSPEGWDIEDWNAVPDRFGLVPEQQAEWHDLVLGLHKAVHEVLSERQRRVFVALVLNGVPLDALVAELGTNRNAIYKTLFDARRKLRARLVAEGHLDEPGGRA
ncbi:sigma-70 family RNA polymerase sigma factor [Amycolatopsis sp. NPDC023774]|uniref:sigma-70 family RNA polymerase sigma factor n=1 Tax=Amycolatopsis sp. NPDC023774 TaxID=3155015 RepID=UPI0033EFB352